MAEVKRSKLEQFASEGCFKAMYGSEWFVKIKPAYQIDKVVFSFVKIKKTADDVGGRGFDVYMDIDVFACWAEDVRSGEMAKVLKAEVALGEKYPKGYKYITGKDGAKSVGFMLSRTGGPMVNASDKGVKPMIHASIPLSWEWLRVVAWQFERTAAERFKYLDDMLMKASTAYKHKLTEADEEYQEAVVPEVSEATEHAGEADAFYGGLYEEELFFCPDKGCTLIEEGETVVIRAIGKVLGEGELSLLKTDKTYQYFDLVFYPGKLKGNSTDRFNSYCQSAAVNKVFKVSGLIFKVGEVRGAVRQLILTS